MSYTFNIENIEFGFVEETKQHYCLDKITGVMSGGVSKEEAIKNLKDIYEFKNLKETLK